MAAGETNLASDVNLDVCSERPEVLAVPRSGHLTVVAGEVAELRCEVTRGSPRPDITWKREVRREWIDTNTANSNSDPRQKTI